ncbi:twin-arginine translocase subunit TatC, partial [Salmonella enterica subsp. enterica serovar Montevideo]|nr:twin-arginine translocase subunit TatC [Salmonella enterica subsp. enterica serovar Montevideo]
YQTSMDSVTAEKVSRIIQSDVIPYKGENHGEVISRVSSAFLGALILSAPVILYQVWAFIAPALYKHERRLVVPLLVSSSLLFYIG